MTFAKEQLLLYAVTDRSWTGRQTLPQQIEAALAGGITCLQLREKDLPEGEFQREALEAQALCRRYQVPLIINDNAAMARQVQADGVHVGQSDLAAGKVRALIGPEMILGVSAQTVAQARLAEAEGADYLGVGAVFPTGTKPDADSVSLDELAAICQAVSIPVVAIGGISRDNMLALKGSGIVGVALVSAIFASPDIQAECGLLQGLARELITP